MRLVAALFVCALIIAGSSVSAQDIRSTGDEWHGCYAIQLGAYPDLSSAQAALEQFQAQGFDPMWIQEADPWFRLLFGRFEYRADAEMTRHGLLEQDLIPPDAFVRRPIEGEEAIALADHHSPLEPVFHRAPSPRVAAVALAQREDNPLRGRIEALSEEGPEVLRSALLEEREARPANDPVQGYIASRLGYLELSEHNPEGARALFESIAQGELASEPDVLGDAHCRLGYFALRDGDSAAARVHFQTVASDEALAMTPAGCDALTRLGFLSIREGDREGAVARFTSVANREVPATDAQVWGAQRTVARLRHRWGERVESYRIFRDIESTTTDPEVLAQCAVSRVGLAFELSGRAMNQRAEIRRMAREAFASMTDSSPALIQRRATLELMFLETYSRQASPDYATAARLGEELIERYLAHGDDAPMREIAAAMHQTGRYHYMLGNTERAAEFFSRVIDEIPQDVNHFHGINPHAQAMIGLSYIAGREGDTERANQIMRDAIALYPNDAGVRRVRETQPNLELDFSPSPDLLEEGR